MKRTLVTEKDIINTYPKQQQKLAYQFLETMRLRKKLKFGYVRISNILGAPKSRVRHWLYENTKPKPIKTIEELKNMGWLPLTPNHTNIRWLVRIWGFIFGDGHLSSGNYVSFSFSNINDLELVKEELKNYFRKEGKIEIEESNGTIKGRKFKGIKYELRIFSSSIMRFLYVLGTPKLQ